MQISGVSRQDIDRAVSIVRGGGIIAFPTETYYGLGVDPFNEEALSRLFVVKNRPRVKPVLVLISERRQIDLLASEIPDIAVRLMDKYWPGALTLVFPAHPEISSCLTGGTGTIGIRLSPHPLVRALLDTFASPVTATSANVSGALPAATAAEVCSGLGDSVDMILDGGATPGQKGSTLVGVNCDPPVYIREGCISFGDIRGFLSKKHSERRPAQG